MNTNFCIGCGAPLEINQNFTEKKCSYCGLDNSYVTPRRENKTFFQRFFAFKRTILPKRNNKYLETEEKYRKRTKTIIDNQISQIQKKEINENKKLREKNSQGIFRFRNFKITKWGIRRRFIFILIGLTTIASIGGYFSQRYPSNPVNYTIEYSKKFPKLGLNFKTYSVYEFQRNIEMLLEKEKYIDAESIASNGIKRYPGFHKLYLLRGIARWKGGSVQSPLKDLNLGLSEYCKNKTYDSYCGWGYGCRSALYLNKNKRDAALKDARLAQSFNRDNVWRNYELAEILFDFGEKGFLRISNKAIKLFESIQKWNEFGLDKDEEKSLIDLYLMQAKYYLKSDTDKNKKKATKVLDKLLRLDSDHFEALLLKNKISA